MILIIKNAGEVGLWVLALEKSEQCVSSGCLFCGIVTVLYSWDNNLAYGNGDEVDTQQQLSQILKYFPKCNECEDIEFQDNNENKYGFRKPRGWNRDILL